MSIPSVKFIEKIKGLSVAVKVAVCVAIVVIAVAVAVAIHYVGSPAPAEEEKKAPEPSAEVVVPEIIAEGEDAVTDPGAEPTGEGLIIETAPKPEEGKEVEYSMQKPKKVKEKETEKKAEDEKDEVGE
jgi:hypothetical protein